MHPLTHFIAIHKGTPLQYSHRDTHRRSQLTALPYALIEGRYRLSKRSKLRYYLFEICPSQFHLIKEKGLPRENHRSTVNDLRV